MLGAEQKSAVDPRRKSLERSKFLTTGRTTDNKTAAQISILVLYYQRLTEMLDGGLFQAPQAGASANSATSARREGAPRGAP